MLAKAAVRMKNRRLSESFLNAFSGIWTAFRCERNMRIHLSAAVLCIVLGIILKLDAVRWCVLFIAIGLVMTAEIMNTAVENLVDMVTDEYSKKAKTVKDIAAGAVLAAAITAAILGILIFARPLLRLAGLI